MVAPVPLHIVCFRYLPASDDTLEFANATNEELMVLLQVRRRAVERRVLFCCSPGHRTAWSITARRPVALISLLLLLHHRHFLPFPFCSLLLQESGLAVVSNAKLDGKFVLRACISNHRTRDADIEVVVREILRLGPIAEAKIAPE